MFRQSSRAIIPAQGVLGARFAGSVAALYAIHAIHKDKCANCWMRLQWLDLCL